MGNIIGIIVIVAIAAFATKPSTADLEKRVLAELRTVAANNTISGDDNLLSGLMKFGCAMSPDECASALRATLTVDVEDYGIAQLAGIGMPGKEPLLFCLGAFTNWWCKPYAEVKSG